MSGKSNQVLGMLSAMNSILQEAILITSRDDGDDDHLEEFVQNIVAANLLKFSKRMNAILLSGNELQAKVKELSEELKDLKKTPPPPPVQKKEVKKEPKPDKITLVWIGTGKKRKRARVLLDLLQTWETVSDLSALCECTSYKIRTVINRLMMEGKVIRQRVPGSSRKVERWQYRVRVPNKKGNVHYDYKEEADG